MPETDVISVYPTMVVGVGGTGCKIVKRLKRTLHVEGASTLNIKFIGMDADLSENVAHGEAEMQLDQFVTLGGKAVHFDPADSTNKPVMNWLPVNDEGKLQVGAAALSDGQGCKGHRLVGRFAYNYFAPDQFINLQKTIDEVLSLGHNPLEYHWDKVRYKYQPGLAVYVIGSLVGGTGSGSFLDAIATLHMLTEQAAGEQPRFFSGIFLLPSVFQYRAIGAQNYNHLATAYSCLKDMDLLLTTEDADLKKFWYYGRPQPYTVKGKLLDSCYLVDRYSGAGALQRDEDVYDFVTTHLYATIGTPFGAASSSVKNNSNKTGIRDAGGGLCSYSAFGLVGLDYSQKLLRRYCAARLGADTIDLLIGGDISQAQVEQDAAGFLSHLGLSGGRNSRIVSLLSGNAGRTFIKRPESMEDERTADLYSGLAQGLQEFERALEGGGVQAELQQNYRENLTTVPGSGPTREAEPGAPQAVEPQMWRHRMLTHLEETVRVSGLRAGKRLAEALRTQMEQSFQDLEISLADARGNVQTAQGALNDALAAVHSLTPAVQIFRKPLAQKAKRDAVLARNGLILAKVRASASEMARRVFNDDTEGLLPLLGRQVIQMEQVLETVQTARETFIKWASGIEAGSQEGAGLLGAPDRSVLIYDVLSGRSYPQNYIALSDRRKQLLDQITEGHSALRLLEGMTADNKAEALVERIAGEADTQMPELHDRHILDVLTEGAQNPEERRDKLQSYLRDVAERLQTHAPVINRPGEAQTYDYCVVVYPQHPDTALDEMFREVAEVAVREAAHAAVQVVPTGGANYRIFIALMRHGIPLNFQAFPQLESWMAAYEDLSGRDPYLVVDKRWRKSPGPGQRDVGGVREKLWTLGIAYGLIARQGEHFYVNFAPSLLQHDRRGGTEREQYEVDLGEIHKRLEDGLPPEAWFSHITQGPSAALTIPSHFQFPAQAANGKKDRESRDRIGLGRAAAMQAFLHDEGEDYQDVADGIAAVMEAYAEQRGIAHVREELTWYRDALQQEKSKGDLKEQYEQEINRVAELLETLSNEGSFQLPFGMTAVCA